MKSFGVLVSVVSVFAGVGLGFLQNGERQDSGWTELFNGRDLTGWSPKITGYAFGENYGDTFRVEDGVIKVAYDKYEDGKFSGKFGHLYSKNPYSNYVFEMEYRFTGNQLSDGPGWATRNSGVMIHSQPPATMGVKQEFPVSIEVQLLGGLGSGERSTGNLCTPGTNVVMGGKLITQHCTNSTSKTFDGDQWVKIGIEVHGNGSIIHRINGEKVMEYEKAQLDPNDGDAKPLIKDGELMLSGGYVCLQAESHPVEFRNVRIRELK